MKLRMEKNVRVWQYMETNRGYNRASFITGSSVHNTRIERLWRASVTSSFYSIFMDLEELGVLNPENDADIFSLHYIFIPRINELINSYKMAWNNHKLSTENNFSPLQLFTAYSHHDDDDQTEIEPDATRNDVTDDNPFVTIPDISF